MILNYEQNSVEIGVSKGTLIFIHGLFGSLSNLGMLVRAFETEYDTVQIDLRNHGDSNHDDTMNYAVMAQDVLDTLDHLNVGHFSVIGHSMGAKVAMKLTELANERLEKLVILDMSPFAYQERHHDLIFEALIAVENADVKTRKDATHIMQDYIKELGVIQFLLKSFEQGRWKFNVEALYKNYAAIISWENIQVWNKPTLFLKGENSDYILIEKHLNAIKLQFPIAEIEIIHNAGHWLHAEQTNLVLDRLKAFLK